MTTITQIIHEGALVCNTTPQVVTPEELERIAPYAIFAQQGDIYIRKLDEVPVDATPLHNHDGQLAPGTSRGSRHCIDPATVKFFAPAFADALTGPLFVVEDECTITHPEHGHITLPAGCYAVTYQRAFADELRRVMD